jgi:hypothetical protein
VTALAQARRRRAWLAIAATVVALVPVLTVVALHAGRRWVPVQDQAVIDLRVRDVWTSLVPLVGPYSRLGWSHPGPAMFYVLAPFSALFGRPAWATMVGAALLQGVAVVLLARLAWRRGGLGLCLGALVALGLAYSAHGSYVVLQPWNPNVAFPFFALFVFEAWAITDGDAWQVLPATIVGSFLVQTHVGYAPLVVAGALYALVVVLWDRHARRLAPATWGRILGWSAVALAVMWVPPVVEQLKDDPGNLRVLWRYFVGGNAQPGVGYHVALGVLAREFQPVPPWLFGSVNRELALDQTVVPASTAWMLLAVAVLAAGLWVAHRAGARRIMRFLALIGVLLAAAVVALARIPPPLDTYLFYWRLLLAPLLALGVVWAVVVWLRARDHDVVRYALVGLAFLLLVGGAVRLTRLVVDTHGAGLPLEPSAATVLEALDRDALPHAPVLVRDAGNPIDGFEEAVIDELDRRGAPARVDRAFGYKYGDGRTADPESVQEVWYVTSQGQYAEQLAAQPGARVVARVTPLSVAEERELRGLQTWLTGELVARGRKDLIPLVDAGFYGFIIPREVPGLDPTRLARIAQLNDKVARAGRCRCAIVAFRPDQLPTIAG